jgi:hypothetical protein
MRAVLLAVMLLSACDDDSTGKPNDLSAGGDDLSSTGGGDLAGSDMSCVYKTFTGFPPNTTAQTYFKCPCGCAIDTFENASVLPLWGASHSTGATFMPTAMGLDIAVTSSSNTLEQAGLASEGSPTSRFFLDGDFDLRVEYDLGPTPPPGVAKLILGTRKPQMLNGTPQYEVEREQHADGSNFYSSMLGGVPSVAVPTSDTKGVLRMKREGFTVTTYAGTTAITTLIAQEAGRLSMTLNASLQGCTASDLGMTCSYTPRWHKIELLSGTLAALPQ